VVPCRQEMVVSMVTSQGALRGRRGAGYKNIMNVIVGEIKAQQKAIQVSENAASGPSDAESTMSSKKQKARHAHTVELEDTAELSMPAFNINNLDALLASDALDQLQPTSEEATEIKERLERVRGLVEKVKNIKKGESAISAKEKTATLTALREEIATLKASYAKLAQRAETQ